MALKRICDRCGVDVVSPVDAASTRVTITIPATDPASAPVAVDVGVTFSVIADLDLCGICLSSLLIEAVKSRPVSALPDDVRRAYAALLTPKVARVASVERAGGVN